MKREAHSVEAPLKHGSRGEIFRRFAERRLYLHLSRELQDVHISVGVD